MDRFRQVLPEDWSVGQRAEVYIETARKRAAAVIPLEYLLWRDRRANDERPE